MWKWNSKKIAYVSILIAASVSFVLIGAELAAITALPSFKVAFGGLPIKITGYLLGPLIGAITGFLADLISFLFLPTYYNIYYAFIMSMAGFVPGVVMWIMIKKPRSINTHFFSTLIILILIGVGLFVGIELIPQTQINNSSSPIKIKWLLQLLACGGFVLLIIIHLVLRFSKKHRQTFILVSPIIMFVAILELHNTILTSFADWRTLNIDFEVAYVWHVFISPSKLVFNVIIISLTCHIIGPMVPKNFESHYHYQNNKPKQTKITKKKIYLCGPTVYDKPHIANLRPIIVVDIFIRALKYLKQKPFLIHNITDVDDKIVLKAIKEGVSEKLIAKRYTLIYLNLLKKFNILKPKTIPFVTKNIPGIIKFIAKMLQQKFAYYRNGNVYFATKKMPQYGQISNQKLEKLKFVINDNKQTPNDFVVWKKTKQGIKFQSPWSNGRPGWHTECAYFIWKLAPCGLFLCSGGNDLLFPHHENTNAQFWSLQKKNLTENWQHIGLVDFEKNKMSKSLKNTLDAETFITQYHPLTLKLLFLSINPKTPINLNKKILNDVEKKLMQLHKAYKQAQLTTKIDLNYQTIANDLKQWKFAQATKKIFNNLKGFHNQDKLSTKILLANLTLIGLTNKQEIVTKKLKKEYFKWQRLVQNKQYKLADKIRQKLLQENLI